ncbi:OmpA/MotB family protein [Geotoga petraea]|jgi:chemotaxis protein MotB|uniref:Chemotaxis protein MotB n=1 Tax=Geotoga petraea TaxID=28234 RepID=A0A1G6INH1_9BACT|nr:flagellar motor protein MotB [Geotoga petraea]MDK2945310.1 chemotaxis protein MotB [Geotoga sp.]SDC07990.1 chemotaxis protein MotB [Geotoga petraea]
MAKKKKPEKDKSGDWMTTFSDLNSLLMTFFVALFSMATISPGKFQQAAMSFNNAFNGAPPGVLVGGKSMSEEPLITSNPGIKRDLLKIVEDKNFKGKITIEETDRGTIVSLSDMAFFRVGSAELTREAKELLYQIGIIIVEHTTNPIEIYGYTDDLQMTENNIYPSNWHLGAARAASVANFFTQELKERRTLERIGEVRNGTFDINYFYDEDRFYPISLGEREILNEIEILQNEVDSRRAIKSQEFQQGEITAEEFAQSKEEINNYYERELQNIRESYRKIDLLILRQRIR